MHSGAILSIAAGCALAGAFFAAESSGLSSRDRKFLDLAAATHMREAYLGQMAETSAVAARVRDFGEKLARDHTDAYESLTELAGKVGASVPRGIDVGRSQAVNQLTHLQGRSFDRYFLREEARYDEKVLVEFRREAEQGRDAGVKAYATKILPILEDHLQKAQALANRGGV